MFGNIQKLSIKVLVSGFVSLMTCVGILYPLAEAFADERFSEFEIRVIRPRFFNKTGKIELGSQLITVTDQTFIYTYLMSGIMTYHFSESIALEAAGAYGFSVEKEDKKFLNDDFNINTQIVRTSTILNAGVLWTPMYGKYQLASGVLVYFDTFVAGYFGLTGVDYQYDHCLATNRTQQTVQYPSFTIGVGQRFFLSRSSSFRWDLRNQLFTISTADGACSEDANAIPAQHRNMTIRFGYTVFL